MSELDYSHQIAFPKLSEAEIEHLARMADSCSFKDGEAVFQAGQRGVPFYVVESGSIAILDESARAGDDRRPRAGRVRRGRLPPDRPARRHLGLCRGADAGLSRAQEDLRRVIQEVPDLSDKLLEAFQARRIMLERSGFVGVRVFGHLGDPELTEIREFFDKNKVPHTWIDVDEAEGPRRWRPWRSAGPAPVRGVQPGDAIAEADGHADRRVHRPEAADPPRAVRPGDRRRRPGRACGGRVRGLGGVVHPRPRPIRPRRAGRDQLADRELHGLPRRADRRGPRQSRISAGPEVRGRTGRAGRGQVDEPRGQGPPAGTRRRPGRPRPDRPDRHRGAAIGASRCRLRALGRSGGLLFVHLGPRPVVPGRPGGGGRRRQLGRPGGDVPGRTYRRGRAAAPRGRPAARACPTTSPAGSSGTRRSRSSTTSRWTRSRATGARRLTLRDVRGGAARDLGCSAVFVFIGTSLGRTGCRRASPSIPRASS